MSGHTPGPWTVNGFGGSFEVLCRTRDGVAVSAGEIPKDGIANARLIAAAPDLLEAAKDALYTLDRLPADTVTAPGVSRSLRAAIAKAEGR